MAIMFSKMAVLFIMGTSRKMIIIKNQAIDMHVQVIMVWYQCSLGEVLSPIRDMCHFSCYFNFDHEKKVHKEIQKLNREMKKSLIQY